jgi:hypothetical protein
VRADARIPKRTPALPWLYVSLVLDTFRPPLLENQKLAAAIARIDRGPD